MTDFIITNGSNWDYTKVFKKGESCEFSSKLAKWTWQVYWYLKTLINIVTYETRKSKRDYFKTYFQKNKNDISLAWIRQLTTLK